MLANKKILVSAGCSHIFGTDLSDTRYPNASRRTWPALLAESFNLEYMCIARPGATCQTVYRRVSIFLDSLLQTHNANEIIFVIQFPNHARFEMIHRDHQWCGEDYPYVTNKWALKTDDADPRIVKAVQKSLKVGTLANDSSQMLIDSLQAMLSTLLLCEAKGVDVAWTQSEPWKFVHLPYSAYLEDKNFGKSHYEEAHYKLAKANRFKIAETSNLKYYKLAQEKNSPVFDTYSATLWKNIQESSGLMLHFTHTDNWTDWAQQHRFSRVKRNSDPDLVGHFNEEAHAKAFYIMHEQILRHDRGIINGTI